jgi:anti-sigma B factor antagonist
VADEATAAADSPPGGESVGESGGKSVEELLEVTTSSRLPGALVIGVRGEVDAFTHDRLAAAVQAALDDDTPTVVIDLSEVSFFGSPGIAVLIDAETAARTSGRLLRVVVDHRRPVIRPLTIMGLTGHLTLFHRLDDALTAPPDAPGDPIRADLT